MTPPIELAALDLAGTTVDEGGLVYRVLDETVAEAVGAPVPPERLAQWKGTGKREAVAGLLAALGADTSGAAVDKVYADFSTRLVTAYTETPPTPFPGVVQALRTLRDLEWIDVAGRNVTLLDVDALRERALG